jgi:hypothetical protein
MKPSKLGVIAIGATLLTGPLFSQTIPNFNAVSANAEGAIHLSWNSASNEVYAIYEADALNTNVDGTTAWNLLYSDYPSQGTNTFWLDTGNYNLMPQIVSPKHSPMRFYRIVDTGPDTTSDEPSVSVGSLTNGTNISGELTITVTAFTDQPTLTGTKLYVDGQEMQTPTSTTNYAVGVTNYEVDTYNINTCEWLNGSHILFATAECESGFSGTKTTGTIYTGHAVSSFVPVVFNNLVEAISFSQVFFDPSVGQIQEVTAKFAANSDWALYITDIYTNTVKTATGSGTSLQYNWDGTDTNGAALPAGIYYYYISAQTNGGSSDVVVGGSGGGSPPSPAFAGLSSVSGESTELWAAPEDGSGVAVPFALYPPGMDTNGLLIFAALPSQMQPQMETASTGTVRAMDSGFSPDALTPPTPQITPPAPQRPPTAPIRGVQGTFGVAYQTYGTNGAFVACPDNGLHVGIRVAMEGSTASTTYPSVQVFTTEGNNFTAAMQKGGWSQKLHKVDNQLQIADLTGASNVFNGVNLGLLMLHGTYGTTPDYNGNANGTLGIYFPFMNNGSPQFVRFSAMTSFGGTGTNGLKWIAVNACSSLRQSQWTTMVNNNIAPLNNNLHMILGSATITYSNTKLPQFWAEDMLGSGSVGPLDIRTAWYQAGTDSFGAAKPPQAITFAAAGFNSCRTETLNSTNTPSGGMFYDSSTVYTP